MPLVRSIPLILLLHGLALAQGTPQQRTKAAHQAGPAQAARSSPTSAGQLDKSESRVATIESAQAKNSSDTQAQLDRIEKAIADLKHSSVFLIVFPAIVKGPRPSFPYCSRQPTTKAEVRLLGTMGLNLNVE
jgi:hypothetical protein